MTISDSLVWNSRTLSFENICRCLFRIYALSPSCDLCCSGWTRSWISVRVAQLPSNDQFLVVLHIGKLLFTNMSVSGWWGKSTKETDFSSSSYLWIFRGSATICPEQEVHLKCMCNELTCAGLTFRTRRNFGTMVNGIVVSTCSRNIAAYSVSWTLNPVRHSPFPLKKYRTYLWVNWLVGIPQLSWSLRLRKIE